MTTTDLRRLQLCDAIIEMTMRYGEAVHEAATAGLIGQYDRAKSAKASRRRHRRFMALVRLTRALAAQREESTR